MTGLFLKRRIRIQGKEFELYRVKVWTRIWKSVPVRLWVWRAKYPFMAWVPMTRKETRFRKIWYTVMMPKGGPATEKSMAAMIRYLKYAYFGIERPQ
jgi:hypothetical protein